MQHTLFNIQEGYLPKLNFSVPNGHFNTVFPSLFYSEEIPYNFKQIEITTSDDDFLELDWFENPHKSQKTVLLLHGLEGSSSRYYVRHLAHSLLDAGFNCMNLNFRSCGSRLNKQRRFYHSGETQDLKHVIEYVHQKRPTDSIFLAGFSMGGNIIQVYLGTEEPHPFIKRAACISAPYNLHQASIELMRGFNQLYQLKFLRSLKKKLAEKRFLYPDLPHFKGNTLYDFDEQLTSQVHGFLDAEDYYKQCSGAQFLPEITIPTLLVHSKLDPFCSVKNLPVVKINQNKFLKLILTSNGGHVGYVTFPIRWIQNIIANWLAE